VRRAMSQVDFFLSSEDLIILDKTNGGEVEMGPDEYAFYACQIAAGFFENADRLIGHDGHYRFIPQSENIAERILKPLDGVRHDKFSFGTGLYGA
jgi:hypothetical protein